MTTSSPIAELKEAAVANTLRSSQLFAGLSFAELTEIAHITVVRTLAKGEYLFHEGAPAEGFYIIQKGAINVHRVNPAGKEQIIHIFRAGESLAEAALASDRGYPADARAVEPSQVILVRKAEFLALVRQHPELALRMLASMNLHLRMLVGQIEDLTLKDVETRLANWLIRRCPNPHMEVPFRFELPTTKRLLAGELGTVSETFSRTLARFRDQQLVAVDGKHITILNPAKLQALLLRHLGE